MSIAKFVAFGPCSLCAECGKPADFRDDGKPLDDGKHQPDGRRTYCVTCYVALPESASLGVR